MTHWVEHYLAAQYRDGARGETEAGVVFYDCWGMVREVLHQHLGGRLMPSWGHVRRTMPRLFTRAYQAEAADMVQGPPQVGAIAAVFKGALMIHVGVVIEMEGRLQVLEINPKAGARRRDVRDFEAPYARVIYHHD